MLSTHNKDYNLLAIMIPAGDHSSRSIVHRRVSSWASWSEVGTGTGTATPPRTNEGETGSAVAASASEELSRSLLPGLEYEDEEDDLLSLVSQSLRKLNWKLWIVFLLMILSGVSNVVLAKLQALPMYNYPTFLNMYANGMYVILSFCYILPVSYFGLCHNSIPRAHLTSMSKKPFMVMGFLDAIAGAMQVLATVYLPGTLLVLLPQAAIPLSMLATRFILRERFTQYQYLGAIIVITGIVVVLFPVLTQLGAPNFSCQALDEDENCAICENETTQEDCESHKRTTDPSFESSMMTEDDEDARYCQWISKDESLRHDDFLKFVWSLVMLASCVPMVLSTVYKQVALQVQLDPILINGWVSLFQFVCGLFLVVPSGYASSPKVKPLDLPENWAQATACLFSQNNSIETGCHPDQCSQAALWVHLGLLTSVVYTVSMILVLKYGSASLLYLGLTLVVPLGHLVFSLHSPSYTHTTDVTGLIVLVAGLVLFRFGHDDVEEEEEVLAPPADYVQLSSGDEGDAANAANNVPVSDPNLGNHGLGDDKNGFLEFLREPFMLVGDI